MNVTRTTVRTRTRVVAAVVLALGLAVGATACGSEDRAGNASSTERNDADVAFASQMIQHHAQAIAMVDLTEGRKLDPDVRALADDIRAAQAPEIKTMSAWLTAWGEEVPGQGMDMSDGMAGMDHGGTMPGMMSAKDMDALEKASDAEFQDMWLEMMIRHHEGAVEMARTEQENGRFQDAVDLAGQIIDTQTAEIDTMKEILGS